MTHDVYRHHLCSGTLFFFYFARPQCHLTSYDLQKLILCYQNWKLLQYVDI